MVHGGNFFYASFNTYNYFFLIALNFLKKNSLQIDKKVEKFNINNLVKVNIVLNNFLISKINIDKIKP